MRPFRRSSAQTARYPTPPPSGGGGGGGALSRGGLLISVSDLSCKVPRGGGNEKKEDCDSWDYDDDADGPVVPIASSPR